MATKRIQVLLSESEYTRIRTAAGLAPLSTWFRNLAAKELMKLAAYPPEPEIGEVPEEGDLSGRSLGARSESAGGKGRSSDLRRNKSPKRERPSKSRPLCRHGKELGKVCLDCGGVAHD